MKLLRAKIDNFQAYQTKGVSRQMIAESIKLDKDNDKKAVIY